jgi:hypothetical protein
MLAVPSSQIRPSYAHRSIIATAIMGIVGNLRTMQLEELLQWLSQSKKTGTLEFKGDKVEKKVFFKDGLILSSASNRPEEYLGHFLVSHGLISEQVLSKAIDLQEMTGMLLGKILVQKEAINEKDLHRMLRLKTEESIYDIFSWTEGEFQFLDDSLPESAMVPMALDVTGIVMEGVQRVDEWRRIRAAVPGADVIPVQVKEFDTRKLDAGEKQILELVDDARTVEDIRLETHSSEFHVCRVLFRQQQEGKLKIVKPRRRENTAASLPVVVAASGPVSGKTLLEVGRRYLDEKDWDHGLRYLRAARSLEPEDSEIQDALSQGEKRIRDEIERAGVSLHSVPRLLATMEQLTSSKLSPQEGFMLTRINGSYDIQSILKITPMAQLDALMVFWKLANEGFIKLDAPRAKRA